MSETQNQKLFALRPEIVSDATDSIQEQFQNKTLRPILKQQNEVLLRSFRQYVVKHKNAFRKLSGKEQETYVRNAVRQDHNFRQFLKGTIVGFFTESEWNIFIEKENELNKRMINLIEQRLISQLQNI